MKRIGQALVIIALGFLGMGLYQVGAMIVSDFVFLHRAHQADTQNQATRAALDQLRQQQQGASK